MRKVKIILLRMKFVKLGAFILVSLFLSLCGIGIYVETTSADNFKDPKSGIIVIDPGHGGIDGGTNKNGVLEKDINLDIAKKLRNLLQQKGYAIIMTREDDIALDKLDNSSKSRHQRDLNARVGIINKSNAQLFLSIHVDCNLKKPSTNGSIVFYNNRFSESKSLAYSIQKELNIIKLNEKNRSVHDPTEAKFFILGSTNMPGVLVETAFISNQEERLEIIKDAYREEIAQAIERGVEQYLSETNSVISPTIN